MNPTSVEAGAEVAKSAMETVIAAIFKNSEQQIILSMYLYAPFHFQNSASIMPTIDFAVEP